MVQINSEITGLKELAKNSDKLSKSFARTTLRTALRNAAKPVRREARARVPVDEGDLRKSIKTKATVKRSGDGYADVGFDPEIAFYGGFVELGTSQQPARPFLRPALEQANKSGDIQEAFITALNKTIERTLGRIRG